MKTVFLKVKEIRQGSTITHFGLYRRKIRKKTTVPKQNGNPLRIASIIVKF